VSTKEIVRCKICAAILGYQHPRRWRRMTHGGFAVNMGRRDCGRRTDCAADAYVERFIGPTEMPRSLACQYIWAVSRAAGCRRHYERSRTLVALAKDTGSVMTHRYCGELEIRETYFGRPSYSATRRTRRCDWADPLLRLC
jgi:hypothetical protein